MKKKKRVLSLEFFQKAGAKGGKAATGKSKVRGDSAYYSRLRKKGLSKRKAVKK